MHTGGARDQKHWSSGTWPTLSTPWAQLPIELHKMTHTLFENNVLNVYFDFLVNVPSTNIEEVVFTSCCAPGQPEEIKINLASLLGAVMSSLFTYSL